MITALRVQEPWREHVTVCPAIDCPLWPVRPMSRYVSEFLARRDAAALLAAWINQTEEDALGQLRNGAFTPSDNTETLSCSASGAIDRAVNQVAENVLAGARDGVVVAGIYVGGQGQ